MSEDTKWKFFRDVKDVSDEEKKRREKKKQKEEEEEYMDNLGKEDGGVCSSKKSYFGKLKDKIKKKK
jgi:hypothetical protein